MKIFMSLIVFLCFFSSVWGYEYSGFTLQGEEGYVCENFCVIDIAKIQDIDEVSIQGVFTGSGQIGLAALRGGELQGINSFPIAGNSRIDQVFNLDSIKKQLGGNTQLYIYHQGNISSQAEYITQKYSFFQKLKSQIFSAETFAPYSINLRYGKSFLGTSIIYIFYILFIVIVCLLIFFTKLKRIHIFTVAIVLYGCIASINLWSFFSLYTQTSLGYTEKQNYHNMGDYFAFTDVAREKMGLDDSRDIGKTCTYYAECTNAWPFCYYWKTLYMQPCQLTENPEEAQYILLHKKEISIEMKDREILYPFGGSYLLK